MRPHRDLPSGSQGWASDVDTMRKELDDAKATIRRLCEILRVDPTRPDLNVNPQTIAPAVNSADKQKLSGLADTDTYNVADKQVLTWSNPKQAWVPENLPAPTGSDFVPPKDTYIYDFSGEYYGWHPQAHGTGVDATTGRYAYVATDEGGELMATAHNGTSYSNLLLGTRATSESPSSAGSFKDRLLYLESYSNDSGDSYYCNMQFVGGNIEFNADVLVGIARAGKGFVLPNFTTAGRPSAAVMGERIALGAISYPIGAVIYDTDLKKPIFWNGTAWTDANGTTV